MIRWIDSHTFVVENGLCVYNYDNMVSIGLYNIKTAQVVKLVAETNTGKRIDLIEISDTNTKKVKELKESFINFYKSRPCENANKIKIG